MSVWPEILWAARRVRDTRLFAGSVILIIGVSVAAWIAVGTSALELLNPTLPYGAPDRLVMIWSNLPKAGYGRAPLSGPELHDLRRECRTLGGVAAVFPGTATLLELEEPRQLRIATVTANVFEVLQAAPALGRSFVEQDEGPGRPPTAILSWTFWNSAFGADRSVIGRRIHLGGRMTEVIGVMPRSMRMVFAPDANISPVPDAWVPFGFDLRQSPRERYFIRLVARLAPDAAPADADRELRQFGAAIERRHAGYATSGREVFGVSLRQDLRAPVLTSTLASLLGAGLVLVMAFFNIAGLFAARAVQTARDRAIRAWLGAGATRLWLSAALEVAWLGVAGTGLGVVAGGLLLTALKDVRPVALQQIDETRLTGGSHVWLLGVVAVLVALLAAATASAATRTMTPALNRQGTQVVSRRFRTSLVFVQVTLAVSLTVGAALWLKATTRVLQTDVGFQPEGAVTFRYSVAALNLGNAEASARFHRTLAERIASISGVTAAGTISHLPYDQLPNWSMAYYPTPGDPGLAREADARPVSPGFFQAAGVRLMAGRLFTEADDLRARRVVVIDNRLAERTWPERSAVGQRLVIETSAGQHVEMTVVGVVQHVRHRAVDAEVREQLYLPFRQFVSGPTAMILRTNGDSGSVAADVRAVAAELDPRLPVWDIRPLSEYYEEATAERRFAGQLLTSFSACATLLVALGLFGLLAGAVQMRRSELGIRIAVGATRARLLGMVLREALVLILTATVAGLALGSTGGSVIAHQLYGVSPFDLTVLASVAAFIVVAGMLSSLIPAWQASRTDPAVLLK